LTKDIRPDRRRPDSLARAAGFILGLAALAWPVVGCKRAVSLHYNFTPGRVLVYEVGLSIRADSAEQKELNAEVEWRCLAAGPDDSFDLELMIRSLSVPEGKQPWGSPNSGATAATRSVRFGMTSLGRLTRNPVYSACASADSGLLVLESILDVISRLPCDPVVVGDEWVQQDRQSLRIWGAGNVDVLARHRCLVQSIPAIWGEEVRIGLTTKFYSEEKPQQQSAKVFGTGSGTMLLLYRQGIIKSIVQQTEAIATLQPRYLPGPNAAPARVRFRMRLDLKLKSRSENER